MTRRLDYLPAPAVADYLRRSDAAILPVGPTEAHGLHLPLGTDTLIALATAELAAERADALVLPPFAYSWPGATARLTGTLRLPPDLVLRVLTALLGSAAGQGMRRLAVVCAHGPDVHTATLAARLAFEEHGVPVAVHHAVPGRGTTPREAQLARPALERDEEEPGYGETSRLAAALEVLGLPESIIVSGRLGSRPAGPRPPASALPPEARSGGAGFYYGDVREHIPTPGSFSAAEGRAYLEATAEAVAASLRAMAV
jgi:creatinine amidohydrolase